MSKSRMTHQVLVSWFCLLRFPGHPTSARICHRCRVSRPAHQFCTPAPFRVGYCPIQPVMDSRCLSAAGFRFLQRWRKMNLALVAHRLTVTLDIHPVPLYRVNTARSRHPKKDVEHALRDVESDGWTVAPTRSGHRWGVMRCGAAGDTSECRASIWSTTSEPRRSRQATEALYRAVPSSRGLRKRSALDMSTFQFTLIVDGPDLQDQPLIDQLFEAGCDDATVGSRDGVQYVDFDREAEALDDAILSARRGPGDVGGRQSHPDRGRRAGFPGGHSGPRRPDTRKRSPSHERNARPRKFSETCHRSSQPIPAVALVRSRKLVQGASG